MTSLRKIEWYAETVADSAALEERMNELRRLKRDVRDVVFDGTAYTITYLAPVHYFMVESSAAHIETEIHSSMGFLPPEAPWSVFYDRTLDHRAESVSIAGFPNNTFAACYVGGTWSLAPGTPVSEAQYVKGNGNIFVQFGDQNGLPLGGSVPQILELPFATANYQPDMCSYPGGDGSVIITWIDPTDDWHVKFAMVNKLGEIVQMPKTVSEEHHSSHGAYSPHVVPLTAGGFMILYSELSHSHLNTVVYK